MKIYLKNPCVCQWTKQQFFFQGNNEVEVPYYYYYFFFLQSKETTIPPTWFLLAHTLKAHEFSGQSNRYWANARLSRPTSLPLQILFVSFGLTTNLAEKQIIVHFRCLLYHYSKKKS